MLLLQLSHLISLVMSFLQRETLFPLSGVKYFLYFHINVFFFSIEQLNCFKLDN